LNRVIKQGFAIYSTSKVLVIRVDHFTPVQHFLTKIIFSQVIMVRHYKRKTDRASWTMEAMEAAVEAVRNGMGRRTAAGAYQVPRSTLRRYVDGDNKKKPGDNNSVLGRPTVLSKQQEEELVEHIIQFERRGFPMTVVDIRILAFGYIKANKIPNNFKPDSKMAGQDWWQGFRNRHGNVLTIRKPQPLSIQRAIGMNRPLVERYFEMLNETHDLFGQPTRIYNADESGLSLVPGVKKAVGKKGFKGSSQITGGERGELVTVMLSSCNAAGNYIPPFVIYKGKRMMPGLEDNLPPGTLVRLSEFCTNKAALGHLLDVASSVVSCRSRKHCN
jgi:hypothetical protein